MLKLDHDHGKAPARVSKVHSADHIFDPFANLLFPHDVIEAAYEIAPAPADLDRASTTPAASKFYNNEAGAHSSDLYTSRTTTFPSQVPRKENETSDATSQPMFVERIWGS